MKTVDIDEAIAVVEQLVAEKGADFVYEAPPGEGCCNIVYVEGAGYEPSCLVGHAYVRLGVAPYALARVHCETASAGLAAPRLRNAQLLDLTPEAIEFFNDVQSSQDNGVSWGDALRLAKEYRA